MIEARLSSNAIRVLCVMDWYTDDRGTPSAFKYNLESRDPQLETKMRPTFDIMMYSPPRRLYGFES